jgi:hypothetical protein
MLAVVGYLVQEVYRFPGALNGADGDIPFASITNGVTAIGEIPSLGWLQIVGSIGYWELIGWEDKRPAQSEMGTIGDVGFYTSLPATEAQKKEYLTKEIQNGRLAMLGIMELITHDIAKPVGESLFTIHHL